MHKDEKPAKKQKGQRNKFARFTGVALQMGLTIYAGNFLGVWLDDKYQETSFEPTLTLLAVFASMYLVIAQVIKASKDS